MKPIGYLAVLPGLLALSGCASVKPGAAAAARAEPKGPKLVLVDSGTNAIPIVVFKGAPPYTRRAADELASYIEKISGAKPEVIEGTPDPVPDHAIWVGVQPKVKELFPKIDFEFKYPEEILIAANGAHLVIAGRDRWDPDRVAIPGRNFPIEGNQQEYGTINAVYVFLEDYVGVRWLWPGEEDMLQKKTIALAPFAYRYHPQIRQRHTLFRMSAPGDGRGMSHDWTRFQRIQLDSLELAAGHAFGTWWDRYHVDHPEYFALQPDGTRSGFPAPGIVKMCENNPSLWDQWLANVGETLNEHPDQICFSTSPNDSWNRGHCICERCRAWDQPDGAPVLYTWEGLSQEYVSLSDRQVTFANTLARMLKQRYPGRDLYVGMHAYGDSYVRPSLAVVPDDNVVISVVACFFQRNPTAGRAGRTTPADQREFLAGWGKIAPHIVWRPNTGSPAGCQQGQPDVAMTQTMQDFRFVAENHCIGMYFDSIWENWPTMAPLYYLMAQMAWDPWQDGQAILDDFYCRGFGPASPAIKAYWSLLEDTRNRKVNDSLGYPETYDNAFFKRACGLLDRADAAVADGPQQYPRRVAFMRAGLDFTRLMIDTRALMARYNESQMTDEIAADQVRANWGQMKEIAEANLMNFKYFKPGARYSQGLHPDYR